MIIQPVHVTEYVKQKRGARPPWDLYFLDIATTVSARADCSRAQHGAVIAKDNRIVSTGYNGAPAGKPGCLSDRSCPRAKSEVPSLSGYDNCISVHAEANALLYADRDKCEGAILYVTGKPCAWCERLMEGAGISKCLYLDGTTLLGTLVRA